MSFLEISLLAAACLTGGIGCWILYKQPRPPTVRALFLFAIGLGIWVGSFFLVLYTHAFIFDDVNHYAGILFVGGLLLILGALLNEKFRSLFLHPPPPYFFLGIALFILPVCVLDITLPAIDFPYLKMIGPFTSFGFLALVAYAVLAERYARMLEVRVMERTQELAALQQRQREFFDDISHALQTPLTVVKSAVNTLKTSRVPDEVVLTAVEHTTDQLSQLIRDILQLSRLDALPPEEALSSIDASGVLIGVAEYVEIICTQESIRLSKTIQPNLYIRGSEKYLEEILTNLLSNAVRYTSGQPQREIRMQAMGEANDVVITIADTGVGIPEEQLSSIFERFYRVKESTGTGYGLGLAITKRLVERCEGTLDVQSSIGKGTAFTMRFPSVPRPEDCEPAEAIQS